MRVMLLFPTFPMVGGVEASGLAKLGVNGHPGGAQLVDIAVDRPDRYLQRIGKRPRGHATAGLQHQQDPQQPA